MLELLYLPPALGIAGLIVAFIIYGIIKKSYAPKDKIKDISDEKKTEFSILNSFSFEMENKFSFFHYFSLCPIFWPNFGQIWPNFC